MNRHVATLAILALFGCPRSNERISGISDRTWEARGQGWRLRYTAASGAEIEGKLDIGISSNAFRLVFVVERSNLTESHQIRSAIEQELARQGLTLDSAVVKEIADAVEKTGTNMKDATEAVAGSVKTNVVIPPPL